MSQLTCYETAKINNPKIFADTIYNNFLYLKDFPELMHTQKNIIDTLNTNEGMNYLVYFNKKLIAYLIGDFRTLSDNRYVYYVSYFYVLAAYRNQKLGSQLLQKLINKCKSKGVKFIVLTCDAKDDKAMNFYKKYGFVQDPILGEKNKRHNVYCLYL